jgi:hypothetical protein
MEWHGSRDQRPFSIHTWPEHPGDATEARRDFVSGVTATVMRRTTLK